MYTYAPSLLHLHPPHPHPTHSRSPQSTELSSLRYITGSHYPIFYYTWHFTYVNPNLSIHPAPSSLPVSTCLFSVCVSIPDLQKGHLYCISSVCVCVCARLCIHINIRYFFFFFWLNFTLYEDSRSIHISANDQFHSFYAWVIVYCIYVPHLYSFTCW